MTDAHAKMVAATWKSVEALGIPDSIVRRMLFELAEVIGEHGDHDLALVSAAYRALTNVLHERAKDDNKTPLQIQADAQRAVREIREMGVDVRRLSSPTLTSTFLRRRPDSSPFSSATRMVVAR